MLSQHMYVENKTSNVWASLCYKLENVRVEVVWNKNFKFHSLNFKSEILYFKFQFSNFQFLIPNAN